jgi:asparagine synthase (glutamine-hydrolysing)
MCGIVGVAGEIGRDEALSVVARMNEAIFHRGPDDDGSWAEDGFAFGMRRLSIIDLSGGHQPMWDDRTGLGVVFNGEVYNYRELRERMTREGETWATHSDTEVVLKSLARSGLEGVGGWNGMFAVAAYDPRDRSLLLVRDRMGVKPLYYFWDGRRLLFARRSRRLSPLSWCRAASTGRPSGITSPIVTCRGRRASGRACASSRPATR